MTREEQLDWLCRLRSEVKIYMPREWVDHFEDALTESIKALSQEPTFDDDWRKGFLAGMNHCLDIIKQERDSDE